MIVISGKYINTWEQQQHQNKTTTTTTTTWEQENCLAWEFIDLYTALM